MLKLGIQLALWLMVDHLKILSFECNRQLKVLYPTPPESAMLVPNAFCVEELCHAELIDCKKLIHCTGCLQDHREWFHFQTHPEDAIAVVRKWSIWMNSGPYEPVFRTLGENEKCRISVMENFLSELAMAAT